jgi:predicted O-methyltransferase YrrM
MRSSAMVNAPAIMELLIKWRSSDRQRIIDEFRSHYIFSRDLSALGLPDASYPVGGAASGFLLYLCLRIAQFDGISKVLELGAGQSTLLFNALRKLGIVKEVTTVESDPYWFEHISRQVDHRVLLCPLKKQVIDGRPAVMYDLSKLSNETFDFILVDGPPGTSRWSRSQAVPLLKEHTEQEFVLVLDDAARRGEIQTAGRLLAEGSKRVPRADVRLYMGEKGDFVLATPKYRAALYL